MESIKILLVDDDREFVELLGFALLRAGLSPLPAFDATQALDLLAAEHPALVVLDLHLGSESGLDLLRSIRLESDVLIMAFSAVRSPDDELLAFELGADDFLYKPFGLRELLARIRARLRRGPFVSEFDSLTTLQVGPLELNPAEYSVSLSGQAIALTPTEFRLLHYLMRNAGRVVTNRALMQHLWRDDRPANTDPLRVAIHRLRRKLGDRASTSGLFHSVAGVGIMLKAGCELR